MSQENSDPQIKVEQQNKEEVKEENKEEIQSDQNTEQKNEESNVVGEEKKDEVNNVGDAEKKEESVEVKTQPTPGISLKELIAQQQQQKKNEVPLTSMSIQKRIGEISDEPKRQIECKYSIETKEKYSRLKVEEVFRTSLHSTRNFRGFTAPKYPVLPIPSPVLVESLILPSDPFKARIFGSAYAARSTDYATVFTRIYSTHRIILVADPIHVVKGEVSSEQFAGLFFKSYENQFSSISSVTSTTEALIETLTDLDLMFTSNKMVPVSVAILIVSEEDCGLGEFKPTVLSLVMGDMNIFSFNKATGIKRVSGSGNYKIGETKGDDIQIQFDWCYFDKNDTFIITTVGEFEGEENKEEALMKKFEGSGMFDAIIKKFTNVAVAVSLNIDSLHQQSFMGRPKKEWLKPQMVKV